MSASAPMPRRRTDPATCSGTCSNACTTTGRYFKDPTWLPPGRVLEMCTIDAAKALGMEKEIGSLEVGKKADIVLLDLRRPHLYPLNMPVFRLIYFANGNDVRHRHRRRPYRASKAARPCS